MSGAELRGLANAIPDRKVPVDEQLVARIEAEVALYRSRWPEPRSQEPPAELAERLPLLGWVIYEASRLAIDHVATAFESLTDERGAHSRTAYDLIVRLADAGRTLPWPEFAPRVLGAVRSHALASSKRDTQQGYDEAWLIHHEGRKTYRLFKESHAGSAERARQRLGLEEARMQLALAETGTACRTAELVIGRWAEELEREAGPRPRTAAGPSASSGNSSRRWTPEKRRCSSPR